MAIINGNNSGNTLNGTNADDIINGLGGNDTINGRGGNDTIDGGSGSDEISGGAGHDALYGGAGNDYVSGNGGNDRIEGGTGSDELNGGSGLDLLYGGDGNDTLSGGGDADTLFGEIGRDTLSGGAANDVLVGGAGADWLTGGSGSDTYLYTAVSDSTTSASDILYGFTPGIDRIDVTALLGVTDLLWSAAGPAPNGLWVGQSGGNTFVYADTNGDSTADFRIRIDGLVTLTASDFLGVQSGVTPPVATADTASVSEDIAPLATGNVLGNDSGTGLAVIAVNFGATAGTVGADLAGDWGVLRLNADGSYTYTLDSSSAVQALAAGQVVQETFTYTASNSGGNATTNLVVTITGTNDAPIAADMSASVSEDVTVNGTLAVATDADGDLVGYALAGAPANGTALVNGDGTFSYAPNPNYNGPDSFTYQVSDSNGGSSTYTVSITIDPVNDPAVVSGDVSGSVVEDFVLSTGGVLTVADADGGEAAFVPQVNAAGAYGAFTVDAAGNWSYVLDNALSAVQSLGAGETVTDSFAVSSLDGTGTATVNVTVTGRGDNPPQLTPAVEVFGPTDGIVTTPVGATADQAYSAIQQSDGKLVVAGYAFGESGTQDFALARYNADGSLDASFGGGGIVRTPLGAGIDEGHSAIQQSDGKLLVAGFLYTDASVSDFALARYNTDGSPDTTFGGGDGIATTSLGGNGDVGYDVIQQGDGKLVVAGTSFTDISNSYDFAITRYNADGSLDMSFGGDGIVTTAVGQGDDVAHSVIQQGDGKLVVAGYASGESGTQDFALVCYNADGSLDTSFGGGDGIVMTPIGATSDVGYSVIQQGDGKLVVAGLSLVGSDDSGFSIARYNADGTLDESFGGGDGIVVTQLGTGYDSGRSVIQQSDGKLVVAGSSHNGSGYDLALARFNADGSLDTSFGGGDGIVTTPTGQSNDFGFSVIQQSDGKLVVAGSTDDASYSDFVLARYNADGSLDATFGDPGMPDQVVAEGTSFSITIPANLFTDPDDDAIAYSATLADGNALPLWIAFDATTGLLSGTAPEGAGTIDVRITATDTTGLSTSDTFTLSIASVNVPPTAADASLSTSEDVTLNGTLPVATDADGDPVSYALAAPPGNGTALVNANGSFTYTPNPNFNGSDSFLYSVSDSNSGSNTYSVNLTVTPAADPATISGTVSGAVIEDSAPSASGALGVSDPDAGEAAFIPQVATPGTYGSFSLDANGNWTYLLDNAHPAVQSLPTGGSAIDAFSVSSLDGTATQTVSITIHGTNDAPMLSASVAATLDEDGTAGGTAVASDVDTDSVLTYSAGAPTAGSVSIDPNSGAWTYTPSVDYHGSDGFLISVSDEHGALAQQLVSLTINPINDPATISGDTDGATAKDTLLSASGQLTVSDPDAAEAALVPQGNTVGSYGTFSVSASGNWNYTLDNANAAVQALAPGDTLTDDFSVQSVDATATQTVTITISGQSGHSPQLTPAVEVFGATDGMATTDTGNGSQYGYGLVQQIDGKLVVAGYSSSGYNYDFALARYTADGSLDTAFGGGDGIVTTPVGSGGVGESVIQQTDGKLVVAGYSDDGSGYVTFAIARYSTDGSLDTSFGGGDGIVTTPVGTGGLGTSVIQQTDGKLVVAGYSDDGSGYKNFAVARHNTDGSLDTSFGGGDGIVTTQPDFALNSVNSVVQQSDGKLVVAGDAGIGYGFALARYNSDGSLDTGFGDGGGILTTWIGPFEVHGHSVIQQSDGKLVVAGFAQSTGTFDFALVRYNTDGSLDTSFGDGNGIVTTPTSTRWDYGFSLIQQGDGKLVVAGFVMGPTIDFALARYNIDGSLDTSFGSGDGLVTTQMGSNYATGYSIIQQSDGKLVVAGHTTDGTDSNFALARYNTDGSLDTTFGDPGMPDQTVTEGTAFAIVVPANLFTDPDGDVITYSAALGGGGALPSWIEFSAGTGTLSGTPPGGAGVIDIQVTATDLTGLSASDAFRITINSANESPTAADLSASTNEDVTLSGALPVAIDADGDPVSYALVSAPGSGTVVVNADGSFSYTPNPDFNGSDSFLYSVSDGNGGSNAYTANITVDAVNDPATIAGTTTGTTTKDTQLTASGVLTVQDPDAGQAALAPQSGTAGSYGTFSVAANGLWSYALDNANAAVQALAPGDTLTDGFTVQSVDATATQTVTVTISGQSGHPPQLTPAVQVFGVTDGIFTINGFSESAGNVLTVIQQSDGKLVGGLLGAFGLMRLNADGTLDASFGGGDGITTILDLQGAGLGAWDVVQSSDGKLVATGSSVNSTTNLYEFTLARFEPDGTPDSTFGGGDGITTTGLPTGYLESFSLVEQTDGKFVVAGGFLDGAGGGVALARYNTDGTLDASFGDGDGIVTTLNTGAGPGISSGGQSLALQKDGKLVVAGSSGLGLVRYNADGSLDTSFGDGDGIASLPLTTTGYGEAVIQQSDGKIVVGGYASDDTGYVFALARYNADGSPDTSFGGGDGVATTALTGIDQDFALTVIQQSDGKLVLGGYSIDGDSHSNLAIARFNGDGSLDADFGSGDGFVETPVLAVNDHLAYGPYGSYGRSLVQQSDGKLILAGGSFNNWISGAVLVRYNPDGSLDSTFGDPGMPDQVVTMGVPFSITIPPNLFTDPDGDALTYSASGYGIGSVTFDAVTGELSGTVPVGYTDMYVYVTATDSTGLSANDNFHITITQAPSLQSGIVRTSIGASSGARSLIEQGDGKLVTAGYGINSTTGYFEFALVRHNENGSLDTTFGDGDGIVTTAPGYNAVGHSVIQQADGKLVVAGIDTSFMTGGYEFTLLRYNTDGTLDSSFGEGDGVVTTAAYVAYGTSVIQQADGRLVLAASSLDSTTGSYQLVMVRYNADGSLDNGFGDGDGVVSTAGAFYASNVIQQADGKLVVAGAGSYEFTLVRYNVDGSLDTSFGDGGGVVTPAAGIVYATNAIQQADGKLVVAAFEYSFAAASYQLTLMRCNSDGALDASFGDGDGVVTTAGLYMVTDALGVIQQTDGKLVVTAATYDTLSGAYDLALIRYDVDGSLDTGFGTGGIATAPIAGTNEFASDVVQLSDGKLAVSGYGYNGGGNDSVLARFNPDGSLDTTFGFVIGDQSIAAGEPYAFTISPTLFRDPEGGALTYSVTQSSGDHLPAWLSFNAATGLLSGTPPVGSADISLRVIAADPLGVSSYVDFDLAIADTYVFGDGFGPQVLTGFTPGDAGADMIDLSGVTNPDWNTFADVQGALSQQGDDAFIDLGNGNSITLVGVAASALNSADFLL